MRAMQPVAYRGKGQLLAAPVSANLVGAVLLIDLWSGIACAIPALVALGVTLYVLSVEEDPVLARATKANWPQVVQLPKVEQLCAEMMVPIVSRRRFAAILMGGRLTMSAKFDLKPRQEGPL